MAPKVRPTYKTTFQVRWKTEFPWVKEGQKGSAFCTVCKKDINFESMGKTALTSHEKSVKHKELIQDAQKSINLKTFFSETSSTPSTSGCSSASFSNLTPTQSQPITLDTPKPTFADRFKLKDNVTEAETLWCLHTVTQHQSLRSSEKAVNLFKRMFPDSNTAQDLKLGKDKIAYSTLYGLSPFFRKMLVESITTSTSKYFIVAFDESLNKFSQTQQMDIVVRFWDDKIDRVCDRYLNSLFLTSSKAEDLLRALKEGLQGLDLNNILQISMDGPNVNKKMLNLLKKELRPNEEDRQILEIGSCGLHTVNVAFKTGIEKTGWDLLGFFRACYYVFKDSPARRGVYFALTESTLLPKKFCSVRWVENIAVCKRIIIILPNLKAFVEKVKGTEREPTSKSFSKMADALKDPLLPAKLAFFQSVAEEVEPFLREFQSDAPMVPFLYEELLAMLKTLLEMIVKPDVIKDKPLKNIDVMKKNVDGMFVNLQPAKLISLSYGTRAAISKCKGYKDKDLLMFRQECRLGLAHMTQKLLEKSPIKYPLTEAISFLNPNKCAFHKEQAVSNMKVTFDIVLASNLLAASTIEKADREFRTILENEVIIEKLKTFSRCEERLDDFWISIMKNISPTSTSNFQQPLKLLLSLSHGNAAVERGFSINGDLIVENLHEDSLIAQRLIYDSVKSAGGIDKIVITKGLILSMRNANSRRKQALEDKKTRLSQEEKKAAEKRRATIQARELEEKKRRIMDDTKKTVAALEEEIKNLKSAT